MSKKCKHEEWNPCGNDFYSCRKCGILRTSQQVNLYAEKDRQIADLEAKLAESENKLNQYPHKNDVIEKQYEDLKDAITFLMLNNIKDQEQLNYSIDILCAKHKARIRDIENGICSIERLKQQLADKEKENMELASKLDLLESEKENLFRTLEEANEETQDKISFAVYELSLVNGMLTDAIIEITQNETDVNKLYYLEKIAKKFAEKTGERIRQLKEME